jgi:hypothetical protein
MYLFPTIPMVCKAWSFSGGPSSFESSLVFHHSNQYSVAKWSLLQENPPMDKWISSWILDPYDQDRKVLLWTLKFLFMKVNYSKNKNEEG